MTRSIFHGPFRITGTYHQTTGAWTPANPHKGLDMVGDDHTVHSPVDGIVDRATNVGDGFGNYVRITGEDGRLYYFAHLASFAVKVGVKVKVGDALGIMGATGNVTGAHTHFEIRDAAGNNADPAAFLGLSNVQGNYNSDQCTSVPDAKLAFPGAQFFGAGKTNDFILVLDKALVAAGYAGCYKLGAAGASRSWGAGTQKACAAFQRAQGWSGSGADGIPGPQTWERLQKFM